MAKHLVTPMTFELKSNLGINLIEFFLEPRTQVRLAQHFVCLILVLLNALFSLSSEKVDMLESAYFGPSEFKQSSDHGRLAA